jgi:cytochrome c553
MKIRSMMLVAMLAASSAVSAGVVQTMLDEYRQQGVTETSAEAGRSLWTAEHASKNGGPLRSCTTCHGTDLRKPGKHARTGKRIEPMAPSVNGKRYSNVKKIRKWFKRNCKWTLGRECSAQEKADILVWLNSQ